MLHHQDEKHFEINNQWLKDLVGRYKSFYSVFILHMVFKVLPGIRIKDAALTEFAKPRGLLWLQFNLSTTFCWIKIEADGFRDDLYVCINSKKSTTRFRSMYNILSNFCIKTRLVRNHLQEQVPLNPVNHLWYEIIFVFSLE
jgi:hypothetical protein